MDNESQREDVVEKWVRPSVETSEGGSSCPSEGAKSLNLLYFGRDSAVAAANGTRDDKGQNETAEPGHNRGVIQRGCPKAANRY